MLYILVVCIVFCKVCEAQNSTRYLTGRVIDYNGNPIIRASVMVKGTNVSKENGTRTDSLGYFKLRPAQFKNGDTLVCSHISYSTIAEIIEGNTVINFYLQRNVRTIPSVFVRDDSDYDCNDVMEKIKREEKEKKERVAKKEKKEEEEKAKKQKGKKYIPMLKPVEDLEILFYKLETPAEFLGGKEKLTTFLAQSMVSYGIDKNAFAGVVKIGFFIDKTGKIKNPFIIKGINDEVNDNVMRVIRRMPDWKPAYQNGSYIDDYRELSVQFCIFGTKKVY